MPRGSLVTAGLCWLSTGLAALAQPTPTPPGPARPTAPATAEMKKIEPMPAPPASAPKAAEPAAPTLMIGDKAPPLTVDTWVKGEPISSFDKGKVYVVEFWATWCGPCVQNIPHLSELQARYKDRGVTVIGISSADSAGVAAVKPLVDKMGDKMAYTVAVDSARATDRAWMAAAGQNMIPTAFVVDKDGLVAWIGYPSQELDQIVAAILDGRFDTKAAAVIARKAQAITARANAAWNSDKPKEAMEILDELVALDSKRFSGVAKEKLRILIFQVGDADAAYAYATRLIDQLYKDDARMNAAVAGLILQDSGLGERFKELALRAACRASDLSGAKDPEMLGTLAQVHYQRGEIDKAVELLGKAIEVAPESQRGQMQIQLEEYRRAREK